MNKNSFLIVSGIVAAVLALAFGLYIFLTTIYPSAKPSTSTAPGGFAPFPGSASQNTGSHTPSQASTTPHTLQIMARGGGSVITVKDFLHNGETVSDSVNPGHYYLAGSVGYCLNNGTCPSGATSTEFIITYDQNHNFLNIGLTAEPIGKARIDAEQFLMQRLGIPEEEMCLIDYGVYVTYWVNQFYSGKNLGFSFCPGATQLPN